MGDVAVLAAGPQGGKRLLGRGPLATVVQDLLSLAIYFAIAVTLIG